MAEVGQVDIKGENIERAVKGFANKLFKLKQILLVQSSNKWTETYYRETSAPLTGGTGQAIQEVARGARFPHVDPTWTKVQTRNIKFAAEGIVFLEDKLTDAIDVQARSIFRVAEAIANAEDLYIYTQLTAEGSTSGVVAAADNWDSATVANRDPIGDILIGEGAMMANNYDVLQNGFLLLRPVDYASLLRNSKVINNPSFKTADVVSNGVVGKIAGLKIIVSNSVSADEAMIVMGQRAATWKQVVPLTSAVVEDKGIKFTIRSWSIAHIQITDPQALYTITNIDVDA